MTSPAAEPVLAMNVRGHLTPAEQDTLWALLAQRLTPHGRVVLNLAPPTTPESVPATPMVDVTLGDRRYLGTAAPRNQPDRTR